MSIRLSSSLPKSTTRIRPAGNWFGIPTRAFLVAFSIVVLTQFFLPAKALAQFGMMGNSQAMQQTISRRGLDNYCRLLSFDSDQKEAAIALLEGHQSALNTMQKEMQDSMAGLAEKMQDGGFEEYQKEMPKVMKAMTEKAENLEKGFFNDLKAMCSEEQLAQWPAVERLRRRETAMRFGFVSGSAVDLIAISDRIKPTPTSESEYKETLSAYELEVDRILVNFEQIGKEAQKDMFEPGAMFDMKRIENMMKKFYDAAVQVRDINRNYARKLDGILPDSDREKLTAEINRRSFPRIYRDSHTQQILKTALKFDDLKPEQKEQIIAINEAHAREAATINEKWAKAMEEKEAKAGGTIMVMIQSFQSMSGGGDKDDPVKEQRDARKVLDDKTKDKVEAILTPDQKSKLPAKKQAEFNPMADFMLGEDEEES